MTAPRPRPRHDEPTKRAPAETLATMPLSRRAALVALACGGAWLALSNLLSNAFGTSGAPAPDDTVLDASSSTGARASGARVSNDSPTEPSPSPELDGLSRDDWRLALVNPTHPIDPDRPVPLTVNQTGRLVDERCVDDLDHMLSDCRAAGLNPFISSAYRTRETQTNLHENQVLSLIAQGLPEEEARRTAATIVAKPGTSEHELGLALDIVDENDPNMTDEQARTPTQQWLIKHCADYGFILRYPSDKVHRTSVIYEPWHYRYVGTVAAQSITAHDICLEEYLKG